MAARGDGGAQRRTRAIHGARARAAAHTKAITPVLFENMPMPIQQAGGYYFYSLFFVEATSNSLEIREGASSLEGGRG